MLAQKRYGEVSATVTLAIKDYCIGIMGTTGSDILIKTIKDISSKYELLGYECVPLIVDDINDYGNIISNICRLQLDKYRYVFKQTSSTLSLTKLDNSKIITDYTSTSNNRNTSGTSNGMSENAPINADINTINSPNTKAQTKTEGAVTDDGSVQKDYSETNPYYYDTYMSILKKYNIFNIIDSAIQKILVEYSAII